ncbi:MAG: hypothetical protein ACI4JF_10540 [Oscillospiraceae bacterium]
MIILVLILVVVPLLFSAAVAFTDYSSPDHIAPNNTINWVGLESFRALFGGDATWTGTFGRVAIWSLTLISEADGVKKYEINAADIPDCEECYVKIDYTGDKARLYIDGQLADDDFYTGEGRTTGLARYGFPKKFEVEIYPLFKNDHIYFEHAPEFDGSMICKITSAKAVCEYEYRLLYPKNGDEQQN